MFAPTCKTQRVVSQKVTTMLLDTGEQSVRFEITPTVCGRKLTTAEEALSGICSECRSAQLLQSAMYTPAVRLG